MKKNIALEKLKAHKKGSAVYAEAADRPEPINKLRHTDDEELQDVADAHLIMDELPQDEKKEGSGATCHGQDNSPTLVGQTG